jgi:hypothetical protein
LCSRKKLGRSSRKKQGRSGRKNRRSRGGEQKYRANEEDGGSGERTTIR